jgi:hypothetical protein
LQRCVSGFLNRSDAETNGTPHYVRARLLSVHFSLVQVAGL